MDLDIHNAFAVRLGQRHAQPVWELRQADGQPIEDAERFLHTLVLRGLSEFAPGSCPRVLRAGTCEFPID